MSADLGPILKAAYPQVVATLTRVLGDMDLAMDAAQDALVKALQRWQVEGVPQQPAAWLVTVGRNRAIDQLRRDSKAVSLDSPVVALDAWEGPQRQTFEYDDIALSVFNDDLLRLLFTCCHPCLTPPAQVTLMLKVVLGFSVDEIARALLTSRASIDKRITRAKQRLAEQAGEYTVPQAHELAPRLDAVLKSVYLLFNQGYSHVPDKNLVRHALIDEAIRLARMICRLFRAAPEPRALLALMLLGAARLPARYTEQGLYVPLTEQDRALWDQGLISEGLALIDAVYIARHPPGSYQIQAAISAIHCRADDASRTDWHQIVALYEHLKSYDASPAVPVNQAVAMCFAGSPQQAREQLIELQDTLPDYQSYHAALAFVSRALGDTQQARSAYQRAADLAGSSAERQYLLLQMASLT